MNPLENVPHIRHRRSDAPTITVERTKDGRHRSSLTSEDDVQFELGVARIVRERERIAKEEELDTNFLLPVNPWQPVASQ